MLSASGSCLTPWLTERGFVVVGGLLTGKRAREAQRLWGSLSFRSCVGGRGEKGRSRWVVKSCDVKMDRARNTGVISCTVCLEEFQTPITYLSEAVDVYSDWIDACEAANQ
ncbi:hypothetical protein NDU88_004204 [Pleurodeles waltl]|uniref:Transcription elongation factor 1 homolog n=1 Tax=Pleurodeles waltl TaxID=8319 RepID=A0AAV7T705_PLEWA|nr:hypothetical protein NDU88_004204 [Pleurodeles waltl]